MLSNRYHCRYSHPKLNDSANVTVYHSKPATVLQTTAKLAYKLDVYSFPSTLYWREGVPILKNDTRYASLKRIKMQSGRTKIQHNAPEE